MLYTLADARDAVGRFVDSGSCDNDTIDARINEALERLTDADELRCMQKIIRISVCNRSFPLPYNVEKIIWANVDGNPAHVFDLPYQFLSSGPGDLDTRSAGSGFRDLVIKDHASPVMFDIPQEYTVNDVTTTYSTGLRLVAFSTSEDDVNQPAATHANAPEFRVLGFDVNGREINPGTTPGEIVPVYKWHKEVGRIEGRWEVTLDLTTNRFAEVSRVIKGSHTGAIHLYAVDTDTNYMFQLGEYHPGVRLPQFTRYMITNHSIGCRASVLALVKMRHVPLSLDDDLLPIDSLQALKLMCIAIRQENAGDIAGSQVYISEARKVLGDREKSRTQTGTGPVILNRDFRTSLGRKMNHGVIL